LILDYLFLLRSNSYDCLQQQKKKKIVYKILIRKSKQEEEEVEKKKRFASILFSYFVKSNILCANEEFKKSFGI
jgi:hypothetical protein